MRRIFAWCAAVVAAGCLVGANVSAALRETACDPDVRRERVQGSMGGSLEVRAALSQLTLRAVLPSRFEPPGDALFLLEDGLDEATWRDVLGRVADALGRAPGGGEERDVAFDATPLYVELRDWARAYSPGAEWTHDLDTVVPPVRVVLARAGAHATSTWLQPGWTRHAVLLLGLGVLLGLVGVCLHPEHGALAVGVAALAGLAAALGAGVLLLLPAAAARGAANAEAGVVLAAVTRAITSRALVSCALLAAVVALLLLLRRAVRRAARVDGPRPPPG